MVQLEFYAGVIGAVIDDRLSLFGINMKRNTTVNRDGYIHMRWPAALKVDLQVEADRIAVERGEVYTMTDLMQCLLIQHLESVKHWK